MVGMQACMNARMFVFVRACDWHVNALAWTSMIFNCRYEEEQKGKTYSFHARTSHVINANL